MAAPQRDAEPGPSGRGKEGPEGPGGASDGDSGVSESGGSSDGGLGAAAAGAAGGVSSGAYHGSPGAAAEATRAKVKKKKKKRPSDVDEDNPAAVEAAWRRQADALRAEAAAAEHALASHHKAQADELHTDLLDDSDAFDAQFVPGAELQGYLEMRRESVRRREVRAALAAAAVVDALAAEELAAARAQQAARHRRRFAGLFKQQAADRHALATAASNAGDHLLCAEAAQRRARDAKALEVRSALGSRGGRGGGRSGATGSAGRPGSSGRNGGAGGLQAVGGVAAAAATLGWASERSAAGRESIMRLRIALGQILSKAPTAAARRAAAQNAGAAASAADAAGPASARRAASPLRGGPALPSVPRVKGIGPERLRVAGRLLAAHASLDADRYRAATVGLVSPLLHRSAHDLFRAAAEEADVVFREGGGEPCDAAPTDGELDPIERAVGFLFGRKALEDKEPMGLKRMTPERFPEQFPAVLDIFAAPVSSDDADMALVRPLLARTQLEKCDLELAYDAERDGWSAAAFHAQVDTRGSAVVLARTEGGAVCGGYNPKGWVGLGEERNALSAFLFCWPGGDTRRPAQKLRKAGGAGLAVLDRSEAGPLFGPDGLTIKLGAGRERSARSKLGSYYDVRPDGAKTLFADAEGGKAELASLRVYVGAGRVETFALDGIVWNSAEASVSE